MLTIENHIEIQELDFYKNKSLFIGYIGAW